MYYIDSEIKMLILRRWGFDWFSFSLVQDWLIQTIQE